MVQHYLTHLEAVAYLNAKLAQTDYEKQRGIVAEDPVCVLALEGLEYWRVKKSDKTSTLYLLCKVSISKDNWFIWTISKAQVKGLEALPGIYFDIDGCNGKIKNGDNPVKYEQSRI